MAKRSKTVAAKPDYGNWSQRISAAVAGLALLGAAYQVWNYNSVAKRATARALYQSYFDKSFEYPKYATPNFEKLRSDSEDWERYKMYVGHMIWAYDEILEEENSAEWQNAFEADIKDHAIRLCTMPKKELLNIFTPRMDQYLRERFLPRCNGMIPDDYKNKIIE